MRRKGFHHLSISYLPGLLPSVECFVKLNDFKVQERDKFLKGKYLKYFLKVTKFHTQASQEFLGDV